MPFVRALRDTVCSMLIVTLMAGCQPKPPTVSYYRAHAQERRERVAQCADDPASSRHDPACINALAAERDEGIGSYRNLPPLHLPPPNADGTPPSLQ